MTSRRRFGFAVLATALGLSAGSAFAESGGGPIDVDIRDAASEQIDAIHSSAVRRAAELGAPVAAVAPKATTPFQYPLQMTGAAGGFADAAISNHVDLAPAAGQTRDFACGSRTYDGHRGTDLFLTPYSWDVMDRKEVRIVAALPGVIVDKADGNFDRQCEWSGNPPANFVIIRHDNGLLGYYWHLKKGSVTKKANGARVAVGEQLGFVGSSGFSTGPHLHFELRTAGGSVIDPYAGQCNGGATRWAHQARVVDPALMRIATHSKRPPSGGNCTNPAPGYATRFSPGATFWTAAYLRDQQPKTKATVSILRPNGTVATSFVTGAPASGFWPSAWWWTSYKLPANAPRGEWRVKVVFAGSTNYHSFFVQNAAPKPAVISANIASPKRTIATTKPANFVVTLRNTSNNRALGCRLSLSRPIDAKVEFQRLKAGGAPVGAVNSGIAIKAKSAIKARLTITPRKSFRAKAAEFPLVAKCANSKTAAFSRSATLLTLTSK